jgi:hypothetical protein
MKRILATLAFIVALAGASVLLASSRKADSCCDPTCCDEQKAASCAKTAQVSSVASAPSCSTE